MALTVTVVRGTTVVAGQRVTVDTLNALGLPTVTLSGAVAGADIPAGAINYTHITPGTIATATATGSAGAYVVDLSPALGSLTSGVWLSFKANHANPGAVTLNVNGLGAVAVVSPSGQALVGGEIASGQNVWVQYDGTQWQMVSSRSVPHALYAADSGAADAYVITLAGVTITALDQLTGIPIIFKATAANTGASTLNVNALGATAITKDGAVALVANDIKAGQMVQVVWDGDRFQLIGLTPRNLYAEDTGTANACVATLTGVTVANLDQLTGQVLTLKVNATNTGAATLNLNAIGAQAITKNYNAALDAGDLREDQLVQVVWDGDRFQLVSWSARSLRTTDTIETTDQTLPTTAGYANATVIAHGLGARPMKVFCWVYCEDAGGDVGWGPSDPPMQLSAMYVDFGASDQEGEYIILPDATNVRIMLPEASNGVKVPHKTTGVPDVITPSKWKVLLTAEL
jgi:hypothetical protein